MEMNFEEAYKWLCGFQFFGIKPGLERICTLLRRLGHPEQKFPVIHIAGTNGKGSTAAIVETILRHHGLRTGLYTSPHLFSICERFVINGKPISPEEFVRLCLEIKRSLKGLAVTYFELTTALAFFLFAQLGVEVAIVECGMGGALDATNVVSPWVTVITSVGRDHEAFLGHSLAQIAAEKAGIIKRGVPVVVGPVPKEALEVILSRAREMEAKVWLYGEDFCVLKAQEGLVYKGDKVFSGLGLRLRGTYQRINLALALKVSELLEQRGLLIQKDTITRALQAVIWPGRYEIFSLRDKKIILDGAHNIDGIKALLHSLREDGIRRYDLLFAASNEGETKPFREMLAYLVPGAARVFLCEPPGPRRPVTVEEWKQALPKIFSSAPRAPAFFLESSWQKALEKALVFSDVPLLVTGSLYLVGYVRQALRRYGFTF